MGTRCVVGESTKYLGAREHRTWSKWYEKTGELRPPKAGEFFLSGSTPAVYHTHNDLSSEYHIMREVEVPFRVKVNGVWYRLERSS
jgi:hypothetical protein